MKLCKAVDNNTTDEIQRHTHNYVEQEQLMKADDAETTKRYIKFAKEDNELLRWNKIKALCIKNMLFTYHHKT